jgi:hypothetical protein
MAFAPPQVHRDITKTHSDHYYLLAVTTYNGGLTVLDFSKVMTGEDTVPEVVIEKKMPNTIFTSLCWDQSTFKIFVGDRQGIIWEISDID